MGRLIQDVRYATRMFASHPGSTAVAVIALALGIGADTAVFSVVNSVLLRPLPYPKADQLVFLWNRYPQGALEARNPLAAPEVMDVASHRDIFQSVAALRVTDFNLSFDGVPERVQGARVTRQFFSVFGVKPSIGRTFRPEDDQPGGEHVAVISHGLWQRRFGGDSGVVGRKVLLNGEKYTVIGITPHTFRFQQRTELWTPLALGPEQLKTEARGLQYLPTEARLADGVSTAEAQARIDRMTAELAAQHPTYYPGAGAWRMVIERMDEWMVKDVRDILWVLQGAVVFVLLIACVNVANVMLARAAARQREIAIRAALGAGRARVIRQLLTESVLLSLFGGALGVLVAMWGVDALKLLQPAGLPRAGEIDIDAGVLGFTFIVSVTVGIIFGVAPAYHALRTDIGESLREGGRPGVSSRFRQRVNRVLVTSELALALVLLIAAGLMFRSLHRLSGVDPGFEVENLLTARVSLPERLYPRERATEFFTEALDGIRALPGVEAAGATHALPMSNSSSSGTFEREERPVARGTLGPDADLRFITPGYIEAMRIPLKSGRLFTQEDCTVGPRVAMIDETLAKAYWPGENPVGKRITREDRERNEWITIVGVVGFTRHRDLAGPVRGVIYQPATQDGPSVMTLAIRYTGDKAPLIEAVREEVRRIDRNQPVWDVRTMEERVATVLEQRRYLATLLGIFAALALLLAGIGIYGVMAYAVAQRSHEIGIRMALGARREEVVRMVVRQGLLLVVVGVIAGIAAAVAVTRVLGRLLYNVAATDPWTYVSVSAVLAGTALLASWIPARRATRVDPIEALRYE